MERFNKIFGLDLRKKCRETEYVTARYAVYHFLFERGLRQAVIARTLGVDRGMVYYGIRRFGELLEIGDELAWRYREPLVASENSTWLSGDEINANGVIYRPVERLNILCGDGIGEYGDNAAAAAKTSDGA